MRDFKHRKSLGQNFLIDNHIIDKIIDSASIDNDTLVIEIGPGEGALSKKIVSRAKYAIFYEIDGRLESHLNKVLGNYDNYSIIINDFLKEDVKSEVSNYDYKKLYLISNLPYYITTPIINKFIVDDILPDKMVLMMQKEVAMRFSAKVNSKDYGALTVLLNYYYDIEKLFDVSKNCFFPRPNVDSAVISMSLKKERLNVVDLSNFKKIVRDSFRYKRKNLRNNLGNYDLDKIEKILNKYGLDLNSRAESVSLDIFVDISNHIF